MKFRFLLLALIHPFLVGLYIGTAIGVTGGLWRTDLTVIVSIFGLIMYIGLVKRMSGRGKLVPKAYSGL